MNLKTHTQNRSSRQLIERLRIPVTAFIAIDAVESHPAYPSLLSISDSLSRWKVDNMGIQVAAENLDEMPVPTDGWLQKPLKTKIGCLQQPDSRNN